MKESTFANIIAMDEEEFASDEEKIYDDVGFFCDIDTLFAHPAYVGVFLHYAYSYFQRPIHLLFYLSTYDIKSYSLKDLKKWIKEVYNFYNTELIPKTVYRFYEVEQLMVEMNEKNVKETRFRKVFDTLRETCKREMTKMLQDFLFKRSIGMITLNEMNELTRIKNIEDEKIECKKVMVKIFEKAGSLSFQNDPSCKTLITMYHAIYHYFEYLNFSEKDLNNLTEIKFKYARRTSPSLNYFNQSFARSRNRLMSGASDLSLASKNRDSKANKSLPSLFAELSLSFSPPSFIDETSTECDDNDIKVNLKKVASNEGIFLKSSKGRDAEKKLTFDKKRNKANDELNYWILRIKKVCRVSDTDVELSESLAVLNNPTWSYSFPSNILATISVKDIERQEAIFELIQTERSYFEKLKLLKNIYCKILTNEGIISKHHSCFLFCRIEEIYEIHERFSNDLTSLIQKDPYIASVKNEVKRMFNGPSTEILKKSYSAFCSLQDMGLEYLKVLKKIDTKIDIIFKAAQSFKVSERLSFFDIYAFVYQRITKYPLLLIGIRKKTENNKQNEEELRALDEAIASSKNILSYINEASQLFSDIKNISAVFRNVCLGQSSESDFDYKEILNRLLMKRSIINGVLECKRKNFTELFLIFYSDEVLILAKKGDSYFPISEESFTAKYSNIIMKENAADSKSLYLIMNPYSQENLPTIFPLIAPDSNERDLWIKTFNELLSYSREPQLSADSIKWDGKKNTIIREFIEIDVQYLFDSIKTINDDDLLAKLFIEDYKNECMSDATPSRRSSFMKL